MSGFSFLLPAMLWSLPLVGLPVVLHLLFRKKAPLLQFSTLQFLMASIHRTAARRRVQRWSLLICRALAVLLLILVASQPAQIFASGFGGSGESLVAVVLVDTSYSMLLKDAHGTLLAHADGLAQQLLRGPLKNAKVAVMAIPPSSANSPTPFLPASDWLTQWSPLQPEPSPRPMSDRLADALELLKTAGGEDKWVVVISDFQKSDFPRQLGNDPSVHVVFLDLHPRTPDSAGVTGITLDPPQPTAGIGEDVIVDAVSSTPAPRPINLSLRSTDGTTLQTLPTQMASFDSAGRARVRFPLRLPATPWLLLSAEIGQQDDMDWDNTRQQLLRMPAKQVVELVNNANEPESMRFLSVALDPLAGSSDAWPLRVVRVNQLSAQGDSAVMTLDQWPRGDDLIAIDRFVRGGKTLIVFLRPGMELSWPNLAQEDRAKWSQLLPFEPEPNEATEQMLYTLGPPTTQDPLLAGLTDKRFGLESVSVLRLVPFPTIANSSDILLTAYPTDPRPGTHPHGLLYRRNVGAGTVYFFSTLPDSQFTNFPTHPLFLPLLVRMSLPSSSELLADNVEIGRPIVLRSDRAGGLREVRVIDPQGAESAVQISTLKDGSDGFVYDNTRQPGIYRWHAANATDILAFSNVQLPASESDLSYVTPDAVMEPGQNIVSASSVDELEHRFTAVKQPQPRWQPMVAILLVLLALEGFLASVSRLRSPKSAV